MAIWPASIHVCGLEYLWDVDATFSGMAAYTMEAAGVTEFVGGSRDLDLVSTVVCRHRDL